ncbi:MAG: prepilin-type N-terminal cleavage/methylation domain-containing protein, partial [Rubritalea sp.]|uniref:prepilin-type N-terminal cleavage/methylation domain-containing protein n=1 Tax=Rubritalea sp. TaxID=2109375 RepID=UPI003242C04A
MITKPQSLRNGFTLLETILAMSILAVMMSVIFSITTSSVSLGRGIVSIQSNSRHQAALYDYLTQLFANLPSDAKFTLEQNNQDFQTLTIENPNTEFPAQGRQNLAKQLWIAIGTDRDGLANLNLETSDQIEEEASNHEPIYFQTELVRSLTNIRWEFYSTNRNEWSPEWAPSMGRPSQIKLFYSYPEHEDEHMHYFWIPKRTEPQLNMKTQQPSSEPQ